MQAASETTTKPSSRAPRIRSDLRVVHDESASFEQAFLLGDRATNRYWQVGPVQFEMARIFSRRDLDWTAACAALRERFDE